MVYFEVSSKSEDSFSNEAQMENLSEQVQEIPEAQEISVDEGEDLENEENQSQSSLESDSENKDSEGSFDNSTALAFQINFEEMSGTVSRVQSAEAKRIAAEEERKAEEARRLAASRRYVSHNNTSDLRQYSGKKIVLFMNADWCPYCKKLDANLQAEKGNIPSNVVIVKVDYRSPLASNYDFRGIPTVFLVRSDGSLIKQLMYYVHDLNSILNQI
jgi:thiol-disulfide isomerase/thioredoxin